MSEKREPQPELSEKPLSERVENFSQLVEKDPDKALETMQEVFDKFDQKLFSDIYGTTFEKVGEEINNREEEDRVYVTPLMSSNRSKEEMVELIRQAAQKDKDQGTGNRHQVTQLHAIGLMLYLGLNSAKSTKETLDHTNEGERRPGKIGDSLSDRRKNKEQYIEHLSSTAKYLKPIYRLTQTNLHDQQALEFN